MSKEPKIMMEGGGRRERERVTAAAGAVQEEEEEEEGKVVAGGTVSEEFATTPGVRCNVWPRRRHGVSLDRRGERSVGVAARERERESKPALEQSVRAVRGRQGERLRFVLPAVVVGRPLSSAPPYLLPAHDRALGLIMQAESAPTSPSGLSH